MFYRPVVSEPSCCQDIGAGKEGVLFLTPLRFPRPTSDMPIMRLSRLETAGRLPKRTGSTMPPWGRRRNG
jgi:hypothetical protein